jgi:general secretion pathway protein E/type IV pilus assembly protein PilB
MAAKSTPQSDTRSAATAATPVIASFADALRQANLVSEPVLQWAIQESDLSSRRLEELLVEKEPALERDLYAALAAYVGLPFDDLTGRQRSAEMAQYLPSALAFSRGVVPLEVHDRLLSLAMSQLETLSRLDELSALTGMEIQAVLSPPSAVQRQIRAVYGLGAETVDRLISASEPEAPIVQVLSSETHAIDTELDSDEQASITRFVNQILVQAIRDRASDIHIEPYESQLRVRFRVDGELQDLPIPANVKRLEPAIISRIKVLANLDIAEKRLSQDGQMRLMVLNRPINVRASVLPTIYGESIVLRLLDPQMQVSTLEEIGMPTGMLEAFRELLGLAQGLILVTGPTGSGKTSTLYASLNYINWPGRKIITVEDPVEYRLDGVSQVQVKDAIGLGFDTLLRNIVRHDPDVLMIGEIRDSSTGQIALNSAMTGHLVLSTLHTNDAPTAVARLANMGIPRYMIAAGLKVVVAQRLVRVLCPQCRQENQAPEQAVKEFPALAGQRIHGAVGCEACFHTGYRGRTGIYEFFVVTDRLSEMILREASTPALRSAAVQGGMLQLRDAGIHRVLAGETTVEEVWRVTRDVTQD